MKHFLSPEELAPALAAWGENKARKSILQLILLGFLAGAYIGFAAHLATVVAPDPLPGSG